MAVHKSTEITRMETLPVKRFDTSELAGVVRIARATASVTTGMIDNADDDILMVRLPERAVPVSIKLWNTDLDSNGAPALAIDVTLFPGDGTDSPTAFASELIVRNSTVLQAAANATELMHSYATNNPITDRGQTLWEMAGSPTNPSGMIDVGIAIRTAAATAATGTIVMEVQYVIN